MNGVRWTTGIGIAVGGVGGAIVALMGAPKAHTPAPAVAASSEVRAASSEQAVASAVPPSPSMEPTIASVAPAPSAAPGASAAATPSAEPPVAAVAASAVARPTPPLDLPTTTEGLLKAELYCDQKKDFDECSRAAEALEKGTSGAADPEQGKRFRRIALTHLVTQCETGSPHACFVMAAKYRAGTELTASPVRAEALEKRGLDLCRLRSAPECPTP